MVVKLRVFFVLVDDSHVSLPIALRKLEGTLAGSGSGLAGRYWPRHWHTGVPAGAPWTSGSVQYVKYTQCVQDGVFFPRIMRRAG